mmetsp:Transcript_52958/g.121593  ORF Transcript_52958/g.121593 Transcript_52958/m.121593 type:complete len:300 (-) Transcript_52958:153-1052(-)
MKHLPSVNRDLTSDLTRRSIQDLCHIGAGEQAQSKRRARGEHAQSKRRARGGHTAPSAATACPSSSTEAGGAGSGRSEGSRSSAADSAASTAASAAATSSSVALYAAKATSLAARATVYASKAASSKARCLCSAAACWRASTMRRLNASPSILSLMYSNSAGRTAAHACASMAASVAERPLVTRSPSSARPTARWSACARARKETASCARISPPLSPFPASPPAPPSPLPAVSSPKVLSLSPGASCAEPSFAPAFHVPRTRSSGTSPITMMLHLYCPTFSARPTHHAGVSSTEETCQIM